MAILQGTAEAATAEETDGQGGAQAGSRPGIFRYPFLGAVGGGGAMVPSHLYRNSMK